MSAPTLSRHQANKLLLNAIEAASQDGNLSATALWELLGLSSTAVGFESVPMRMLEKAFAHSASLLKSTQYTNPAHSQIQQKAPVDATSALLPNWLNEWLSTVNGRVLSSASDSERHSAHVSFALTPTGNQTNFLQQLDLLHPNEPLTPDDRLSALHDSIASVNHTLNIAPHSRHSEPLVVIMNTDRLAPRLDIHCGARSSATVVQINTAATGSLSLPHTHVVLHEHSELRHICLNIASTDAVTLHRIVAQVHHLGQYQQFNLDISGKLNRTRRDVHLLGQAAATTLNAILNVDNAHSDHLYTKVTHHVKDCHSQQITRGLGHAKGMGSDQTVVHIKAHASGSGSTQSTRHLLLDDSASIQARPILEIFNNDVKAAHGSTVGTLDPAMAFYLRSRGLSHAEAQRLLLRAFWHEALVGFENCHLAECMDATLTQQLLTRSVA